MDLINLNNLMILFLLLFSLFGSTCTLHFNDILLLYMLSHSRSD